MQCPDCEKELFVSKKVDSIILLCSFCGLNKRYYTLDKEEAYERLLEQRSKKSSKPENKQRNAALPIIKSLSPTFRVYAKVSVLSAPIATPVELFNMCILIDPSDAS